MEMTNGSTSINVNPRVLKWARMSAGYPTNEVSKALGISEATVEEWEKKESTIKVKLLRKLAKLYKRSFEVFLLPAPPQERPDPKYRLLKNQTEKDTRETIFIIRESKWLQDVASELSRKIESNEKTYVNKYNQSTLPESAAIAERKNFNISIEKQMNWTNEYVALREWISAVERLGVLVFQISMPNGIRGFSLPDKNPPVIAINTTDTPKARIFTLFHEYAHLLLGDSGVCDPSNQSLLEKLNHNNTETWCNQFAASFMMPKNMVIELSNKIGVKGKISTISSKLKVSNEALLIRLYGLNLIELDYYKHEIENTHKLNLMFKKKKDAEQKQRKAENKVLKIDPIKKIRRARGKNFIHLVMKNKNKGYITTKDAMDYLSVNADHLDKLEGST